MNMLNNIVLVGGAVALAGFFYLLPPPNVADIVLIYEKTTCYGTCPSYVVRVYKDGTVQFEGKEFVKWKGSLERKISLRALQTILNKANKINFWRLNNVYDANITDIPSTFVTIRNPQTKTMHKVKARANMPPKLVTFNKELHKKWKSMFPIGGGNGGL